MLDGKAGFNPIADGQLLPLQPAFPAIRRR
jgi:hypothetical protein